MIVYNLSMPIGLILSLFTLVLICCIFVFNNKTKKIFNSYWFYSIVSFVFLVYFLIFRWANDLKCLLNNDDRNLVGGMDAIYSKVFLLDMCPFCFVTLSISLIVDRKRILPSAISIIGIVGGFITVFGQITFEGINSKNNLSWVNIVYGINWWEYIFLNELYFPMHFYLIIMSIIVLMNSKAFNLKKIVIAHIYPSIFFIYIVSISFTLYINWNVTGIRPNDWSEYGEYQVIGKMLPWPWPLQPICVFLFVFIVANLMIQLRNIMVIDKKYASFDMFVWKRLRYWYIRNIYNKLAIKNR